jgi:hypothetical protein
MGNSFTFGSEPREDKRIFKTIGSLNILVLPYARKPNKPFPFQKKNKNEFPGNDNDLGVISLTNHYI